jgi:acyl-CoA reductase-like NAD-dependent aldehyde dehydrogenase
MKFRKWRGGLVARGGHESSFAWEDTEELPVRFTARRIAQGRWNNAGQTCTAPDYILEFKDVAKWFLEHLKE